MKAIVLGAGLIGAPMAVDLLAAGFLVTVVDRDADALGRLAAAYPGLEVHTQDLADPAVVGDLVAGFDFALSSVPGFMGTATLRAIIEARVPVVDIAFSPEDPFALDAVAKANGVVAVVDCGVAPGLSNLLAGAECHRMDRADRILIYVGGLPVKRVWPFEYKAVFSPVDVIEEYTRPARYVENGHTIIRPALSDPELLEFPRVGTLEAFNTDGLRTLATTLDVPHMKEKTLRYPGHIEKMAVLRETGFFDTDEIDVRGVRVRPIDVTAALMFPKWKLGEDEADLTVMQVIVEGEAGGRRERVVYDLYDERDLQTGTHSMARTTGYTATTMLRYLAQGGVTEPGVYAPETLAADPACTAFILDGLCRHDIRVGRTVGALDAGA